MSVVPPIAVLVAPGEPAPAGLEAELKELDGDIELCVAHTEKELVAAVAESRILISYDIRTSLVRRLGDRVNHLEWIHAASAGVDAVLTPEVAAAPTIVTNARGVFDRPIAEYCMTLLLAFAKDLPATLGKQREREWSHRETRPIAGRRLLVVGAGSIGSEVARLGAALGMRPRGVASTQRDGHPVFGHVYGARDLHAQLSWADDVVICTPLTEATRGMFDRPAFAALRPGATLVNVGRGAVVDEDALLEALRAGAVGAAALDVFQSEPLPADHPFWGMPQVIVSPHMSGDDAGWVEALARQFAENFVRWRRGQPLLNVVDKHKIQSAGQHGAGSNRQGEP